MDGGVVVSRMLESKGNRGSTPHRTSMSIWWMRGSWIRQRSSGPRSRMLSVAIVLLLTEATMTEIEEPGREGSDRCGRRHVTIRGCPAACHVECGNCTCPS